MIDDWVKANDHHITGTRVYDNEPLPSVVDFDFLIVMGGPQSACEINKYAYLQKEVGLIRQAVAADKYVLGVCLGAQLIGEAMGAKAERSPEKEIGCFSVELTEAGKQDKVFQHLPDTFSSMHWHYDMPGLPATGTLLAKSAGCPRQAVRFSERVYGLQFHLEFTKEKMETLIDRCHRDLSASQYTQSPQEILMADFKRINDTMQLILDKITGG